PSCLAGSRGESLISRDRSPSPQFPIHTNWISRSLGERMEGGGIRGFVERPYLPNSEPLPIHHFQSLTKREHSVKVLQPKLRKALRRRRRTMMGVVKEQLISKLVAQLHQHSRQDRRIPFMQDYELGSAETLSP